MLLFLRKFFFIVRHAIILSIVMTLIIWGRPVKYWFFFFQTEISVFDGHPCNNHLRLFVYYYITIIYQLFWWCGIFCFSFLFACASFVPSGLFSINYLPANFTVNMIHITHGLGRVLISKPDVNCTYKT